MEIIDYFKKSVFENYANFKGRARRTEFWYFNLVMWVINMLFQAVSSEFAAGTMNSKNNVPFVITLVIFILISLVLMIPSLSVFVRRLHDYGKSGWWFFLAFIPLIGGIILLVWTCKAGQVGPNKWGPDPKNPESNNEIMKAFEG